MKHLILTLALICAFALPAQAATRAEQRAEIQNMRNAVLNDLYKLEPQAKREIENAAGHAVFSSADLAAIFFSGSYGHGIAYNNNTNEDTYMQMASAGVGLGLGVKDFRVVFIFDNPNAYYDFVTTGLDLSGNIDVAVKGGGAGGSLTGAQHILPGVRAYQMTASGLLAQAMLKGTKYWRDDGLNEYDKSSQLRTNYSYNE